MSDGDEDCDSFVVAEFSAYVDEGCDEAFSVVSEDVCAAFCDVVYCLGGLVVGEVIWGFFCEDSAPVFCEDGDCVDWGVLFACSGYDDGVLHVLRLFCVERNCSGRDICYRFGGVI